MAETALERHESPRRAIEELQLESLHWASATIGTAAFGLLYAGLAQDRGQLRGMVLPLLILCVAIAGWRLAARSRTASALCLGVGLASVAFAAAIFYRAPHPLFALSVLVALTPAIADRRWVVISATVMVAAVLGVVESGVAGLSSADGLAVTALVIVGAALSSIAYGPLRTTLDWSWRSYLAEQHLTEEARRRQAQLARVSKSLAETVDRLEHVNWELNHARRAADEARRQKEEFAAAISHELRTPLNLVVGFAEVLLVPSTHPGAPRLAAPLRRDIVAIHQNACHMSRLIDDVLDLSQVDAHRMALDKRDVRLRDVIDDAVAIMAPLYQHAGLFLRVEAPDDLPPLHADPTRLRQIVLNLISNAVRFTDVGGVTVSARVADREVIVAVADTGDGIEPDEIAYVFRPFQQAGPARRRRGGSGLGLAVCQRFAELHGGRIWVESAPGHGSTFYVALPVAAQVVTEAYTRLAEPRLVGRPTVLVVERGRETTRVLGRYLDGYDVLRAGDVRASRRAVARHVLHAVVLGDETAHATWAATVRGEQRLLATPVLTCTFRAPPTVDPALEVAAVLTKPVERKTLLGAIDGIARSARDALIVEDEPNMSRLLAEMIRSEMPRCRTRRVGTVRAALAALQKRKPDVVLLDLQLDESNGEELVRAMRADASLREIPIVVVTGRGAQAGAIRAENIGVSRADGLTVGQAVRCLGGLLHALPGLAPTSDQAPPVGSAA